MELKGQDEGRTKGEGFDTSSVVLSQPKNTCCLIYLQRLSLFNKYDTILEREEGFNWDM